MTQETFRYRQNVLDELERFGIYPRPTTPPALVREFLRDLYLFEIRKLKQQQLALEREVGRHVRTGYADKVVALKKNYPLLSLPVEWWVERPGIDE